MLHQPVRLVVSHEKIQDPVNHEDDVEHKHQLHVFQRDSLAFNDQDWGQKDVDHEYDLGTVVPLHIPVVVWTDDEPRDLLVGTSLLLVLDIVTVVLLPFIHFLDLLAAQLGHHPDHFFLLADCRPVLLGFLDLDLLLVFLYQQPLEQPLLELSLVFVRVVLPVLLLLVGASDAFLQLKNKLILLFLLLSRQPNSLVLIRNLLLLVHPNLNSMLASGVLGNFLL